MDIYYNDPYVKIIQGDCRGVLVELPAESVQCVVTSPPYWGLRKYSGEQDLIWGDWVGSYGLEPTPEMYIDHTIEILRAIRRVLRKDGVVFWNIGDSYFSSDRSDYRSSETKATQGASVGGTLSAIKYLPQGHIFEGGSIKPKDICLIPFRVAIAAQEDGWWVRSIIIWNKPNPMPESADDRPTKSHEYILMLTKSADYYWDADAVREQYAPASIERANYPINIMGGDLETGRMKVASRGERVDCPQPNPAGRSIHSVWTFPTEASGLEMCLKCKTVYESAIYQRLPSKVVGKGQSGRMGRGGNDPDLGNRNFVPIIGGEEQERRVKVCRCGASDWLSHFAAFPEKLPEICIKAATKHNDLVLDPMAGSGRTGKVAKDLGRKAILIDTSDDYCRLAKRRIEVVPLPMIFAVEETYPKAPDWF